MGESFADEDEDQEGGASERGGMRVKGRRKLTRRLFCGGSLVFALAAMESGTAAPEAIRVRGVDGKTYVPLDMKGKKAAVLVFLGSDCPISNAFAPELGRIHAEYAPKGVALFGIYPDPTLETAAAARHGKDFGLRFPLLLDPQQKLVRKAGATLTPEAAVFDATGRLVYRGRINDLYVDLGKKRFPPTTRDLRDALDAVLAGKQPAVTRTRAIGCFIPEP